MTLSIVVSKADAKEGQIITDSGLEDVLAFLKLLGVVDWSLRNKGSVALEMNRSDLFVAVGPLKSSNSLLVFANGSNCSYEGHSHDSVSVKRCEEGFPTSDSSLHKPAQTGEEGRGTHVSIAFSSIYM